MQITNKIHAFIWQSTHVNNCNTYMIDGPTRILIDPGHYDHFNHVRNGLKKINLDIHDIGLIICTHLHPDHIEAVSVFKNLPTLLAIHEAEWQLAQAMKDYMDISFTPDFFLKDGILNVNGVELSIIHTPGHSPDSISIYWPQQKALFTGDLIFKDGLGRTDIPGGNGNLLKQSISGLSNIDSQLFFPGHGDIISEKKEIKDNFKLVKQQWFAHI